jgi:hypothetical protein
VPNLRLQGFPSRILSEHGHLSPHSLSLAVCPLTPAAVQVLKANIAAVSFYTRKLKFVVDPQSPSACGEPDEPHEILSKSLVRGAPAARPAAGSPAAAPAPVPTPAGSAVDVPVKDASGGTSGAAVAAGGE